MRFVDEVTIRVQAGDGGRGCVSFRREKYVPRGGPDGGDGGQGGDVYLEATERKQTLLDFHYRHLFKAPSGTHGRSKNQHGRGGADLILEVPVGTLAKDPLSGEVVADLVQPGARWRAAAGGRGGQGNARFATATCKVPRFAQDGQSGEERDLLLELKLLADVGLVGFPNAGKSTLISVVSAARPKIADYPFTTLVPHLGVVAYQDAPPFVMADIPGLIEGAHSGAGLGTRFLKHIERTRLLVHLVDLGSVTPENPLEPYHQIKHELERHSAGLVAKPCIIALNKTDLVTSPEQLETIAAAYRRLDHPVVCISALRREGLEELLQRIIAILSQKQSDEPENVE
jgi:GTP-binding protein